MINDPDKVNAIIVDRIYELSYRGLYTGEFWSLMFVLEQREKEGLVTLNEEESPLELWQRLGTKPVDNDDGSSD